tara:strand:- start:267 stop:1007 length:741 start_codon:yes stop_codon:yes gene_type:complete
MIVANWKCNGSKAMIDKWFKSYIKDYNELNGTFIGIAPPTIYIERVSNIVKKNSLQIMTGSQDVDISSGARTGAISIEMILDNNCCFSIIGHSERREFFSENHNEIRQKIIKIMDKTIPILCVGETLEDNKKNLTKDILKKQLEVINNLEFKNKLIIAYEPVWAIGSGITPDPKDINEIHKFIKDVVQSNTNNSANPSVLYGGSVNSTNAASFFYEENIDGALVGGAALDGSSFAEIVNLYNGIKQ